MHNQKVTKPRITNFLFNNNVIQIMSISMYQSLLRLKSRLELDDEENYEDDDDSNVN